MSFLNALVPDTGTWDVLDGQIGTAAVLSARRAIPTRKLTGRVRRIDEVRILERSGAFSVAANAYYWPLEVSCVCKMCLGKEQQVYVRKLQVGHNLQD